MPLIPKITTRKERLDTRSAVPKVAEKIKDKSFFSRRFVKKLARASLGVVRRLKRDWKEFCNAQPEDNPFQVYPEIDINTKLPPRDTHPIIEAFIAFTTHQALSSKGRISEYATRDTIRSLMGSFFGIWRREALKPLPYDYTQQVYTYIDSEELEQIAPLCTDSMPKHSMSAADFEVLSRALFRDTGFRTLRMALQVAYLVNLQSLMTERPGAIVEGTKYHGTNEALKWGEHEFHIIPNSDDPHHPLVIVKVKIHRQKGYRGKKSVYKEFILYPEPNANRAMCPVAQVVALAIQDQIFAHVTTAEEIFCPKHAPTKHHILSIKPSALSQCVARAEVLVKGIWGTSSDRALSYSVYSAHLRRVSLADGFIIHVTPYCFRRGASNRISRELGENDLHTLMGHTANSQKFISAYQSRLVDADLSAVLYDREENSEHVQAGKAVSSMSARRDNNAPVELPLEHMGEILNEPELVDMRQTRQKLANEISATSKLLVSADVDEEEQNAVSAKILELKRTITLHDREYRNIIRREKKYLPHKITRGKENASGLMPVSKPISRTDALEQLIGNFFDAGLSFDTTADSILGYIDALNNIPAKHKAVCYLGESPDENNECPACGKECTITEMPKGIGRHIHSCIANTMQEQATLNADEAFKQTQCFWNGCFASKTVWKTRKAHLKHLTNHINWLKSLSIRGDTRRCRWYEQDRICNETAAEDDDSFWEDHFASAHGINTSTTIRVDHCASCGEWYEDLYGDCSAWNDHCIGHYEDAFAPFQERLDQDVILQHDENVIVVDGTAEYDPTTGFGGKQPLLHGYIEQYIALRPFYCPFCVFDTTKPMFSRMKQFRDNTIYSRHVFQQHLNDLEDDSACPVPSCGIHVYSVFDLVYHLVLYHRLPLVGTNPSRNTRKLRIPTKDDAGKLVIPLAQNQAKTKAKANPLDPEPVRKRTAKGKKKARDSSEEETIPKRATSVIEISDDEPVARSSSVIFVEPGPSKRRIVISDESDQEKTKKQRIEAQQSKTKKQRFEELVAGPLTADDDDDDDDDDDGIDDHTRRYLCLGCYNQYQDIQTHSGGIPVRLELPSKRRLPKACPEWETVQLCVPPHVDTSVAGSTSKKNRYHYCTTCKLQFTDIRDHIPDKCQSKTFRIKDPNNPAHRRARNAPLYTFVEWVKTAPPRV
ncbi:uncharacterized protein EV420DRAFT_1477844 [Desarmillaria tabescens]|uniref:C2H2-type domain-containing protein n=1 Tax=Armillaria tabescens TaxID=1929756 RepID=A0AA39N8G8_ARMTA|nr:uncharacterized protein EV420DRAFT_1477844 [Desarmillaria tabescens]KAK0460972.1 hypothetical protein EV420DRAFT_1477844 [Desarmillaria tabescens]